MTIHGNEHPALAEKLTRSEHESPREHQAVHSDIINSLNSDSHAVPTLTRDATVQQHGNILSFDSANHDPLRDIRKDLGIPCPQKPDYHNNNDNDDPHSIDHKSFDKLFEKDVKQAAKEAGNSSPDFWNSVQNKVDNDLQRLEDKGRISPTDKNAFDAVFIKDAKDVYNTDGKGNVNKFWHKLEDRIIHDMRQWHRDHDLPTPPDPNVIPDVPPAPTPDVPPAPVPTPQPGPDVPPSPGPDVPPSPGPDIPPTPTPTPDVPPAPTPAPTPDVPTPNPDVPPDVPTPAPTPFDGTVSQARDALNKSLEGKLSPERLDRMKTMEAEFEKRGHDRVEALVAAGHDRGQVEKEWQDKIGKTYKNISDMVNSNSSSAPYDQATRAKMAENAMYLVMDPTKENQGQHGTCWIESGINRLGLVNHPDEMSRLLKEVTTTGSYTDLQGQKYTVPSQLLQFPGEESSWTISNADEGLRSPVGAIFDRTISYMDGRTDGGTNGGDPYEMQTLMQKVTGETAKIIEIRDNYLTADDIQNICSKDNQKAMLEQGGICLIGPGHMFDASLVKNNGQWQVIGDNQWGAQNDQLIGQLSGDLSSWNINTTRDRYVPEEQNKLAVNNDSSIGMRSAGRYNSAGFYYGNYSIKDVQTSASQPQPVMPLHADNTVIYDDYNPNYRMNVPGGGETHIPHGHKHNRQFNLQEHDYHQQMMDNWAQLLREIRTPITASARLQKENNQ